MPISKEDAKILLEIKDAMRRIKAKHPTWTFVMLKQGVKEQRPIGYALMLPHMKES